MISEWLAKRKLRKHLHGCNYEMAKTILVRKFSGGVIPNELARLLDAFISNPCFNTAIKLIQFDSTFFSVFDLARRGGVTNQLFQKGDIR